MSKIDNIAEKLNKSLNRLQPTLIDSIDELERENKIYREEIMRLQSIVKGLIQVLSDKIFIKQAQKTTNPKKDSGLNNSLKK